MSKQTIIGLTLVFIGLTMFIRIDTTSIGLFAISVIPFSIGFALILDVYVKKR